MLQTKRRLKILTFDIETRPLSFWYDGKPTAEITAIASAWNNDITTMEVKLLGRDEPTDILSSFVTRYNEADIVSGHFIRRFDLPMINGALMEYGMPQLLPKLTIDTKNDLRSKGDIPATQEFLSDLFGISIRKKHMGQQAWREGNRLHPDALKATEDRVTSDVLGNILLCNEMLERNLLKAPKIWRG